MWGRAGTRVGHNVLVGVGKSHVSATLFSGSALFASVFASDVSNREFLCKLLQQLSPQIVAKLSPVGDNLTKRRQFGDNLRRQFGKKACSVNCCRQLLPAIAASNCCQQLLPAICSTETY